MLICPVERQLEALGTTEVGEGRWKGRQAKRLKKEQSRRPPFLFHRAKHLPRPHLCRRSEAHSSEQLIGGTRHRWGLREHWWQTGRRRESSPDKLMAPDKRTTDIDIWEFPRKTTWSISNHPAVKLNHPQALHTPRAPDWLSVPHS